jgi:hypothetical protein
MIKRITFAANETASGHLLFFGVDGSNGDSCNRPSSEPSSFELCEMS